MNNVILKKEKGIVTINEINPEKIKKIKEGYHLCWDSCANAYTNKCPKIRDVRKKTIDAYDFITDGSQIIDSEGEVETFIVSECNRYEKTQIIKKTQEELDRLQKIKEGLRMAYFDTLTVEDAYIVQYELEKRNLLTDIRGKRPRSYNYYKMKAKKNNKRL